MQHSHHTFICRITQSSHEIIKWVLISLEKSFGPDYQFHKKFNPKNGDYEVWVSSNKEVEEYTLAVMRGEKEYK